MKIKSSYIFFIVLLSFCFQQFTIPGLSFPLRPFVFAIIIALLFILLTDSGRRFPFPFYIPFVCVFFLYIFSSFLWALEVQLALVRIVWTLFLCVTYFTLVKICPYERVLYLNKAGAITLYTLLIAILLYYCLGLYSFYIQGYKLGFGYDPGIYGLYIDGILPRLRGFMDSPNNMGLLLLPLFYGIYLLDLKLGKFFIILIFAAVIFTLSVTTYLAFLLPLTLLIILKKPRYFIYLLLGSSIFIFLIFIIAQDYELINQIISTRLSRVASGSGRFDLFGFVLEKISENPFLGYGIAQARVYLLGFQGRDLQSSHNSFLESFFEGGIIGLTLFVLCWVTIAFYILTLKIDGSKKIMLFCYLGSLVLFSFSNMMIYVDVMVLNLFFIWFFSEQLKLRNGSTKFILNKS